MRISHFGYEKAQRNAYQAMQLMVYAERGRISAANQFR